MGEAEATAGGEEDDAVHEQGVELDAAGEGEEAAAAGAESLVSKKPRMSEAVKLLKINRKRGISGVAWNSGVIR
ncbi:MAG TPA: hypothetical protein VKG86_04125 [Terracidiphilus sp.]|nr:hypothetical protein [Terracidiphilus sp.]